MDADAGWGCAATILLVALIPLWSLYDAWAVRVFWGWYITPGWGVPVPSYLAVVGATMLFNYLKPKSSTQKSDKDWKELVGEAWISNLIVPLLFLAVAWFIKVILFR
jgi:hypothetical protein